MNVKYQNRFHTEHHHGPVQTLVGNGSPVLNEENHIEACLNSLLHQSLPANEHMILVMDGGSTDATKEIIQSMMRKLDGDKHPTLVYHENPGRFVPHARNLAMQHLPESITHVLNSMGTSRQMLIIFSN